MRATAKSVVTLSLGMILGAAGFNLFMDSNPLRADDTRKERIDEDKWTTGDRARDALEHLKKSEAEMLKVADDDGSKLARDGAKECSAARTKVDEFVAELDARAKKH